MSGHWRKSFIPGSKLRDQKRWRRRRRMRRWKILNRFKSSMPKP